MILPIVLAVAWAVLVAVIGARLTDIGPWYRRLRKPTWQPPDWLFGPAWTAIFALAATAFVLAWRAAPDGGARAGVIAVYAANGALNILWNPLFFTLRRPDWALYEVPLLWLSIVVAILRVAPLSHTAAWLLAPYLVWVSFASVLNLAIVRRNRPFGAAR
jgi:benzodiazapine receptor